MRPLIWTLVAMAVAVGTARPARADARAELLALVMRGAEQDFEAVREAAGLSGSSPLVGLKAEKTPSRKHATRSKARAAATSKSESKRVTTVAAKAHSPGQP